MVVPTTLLLLAALLFVPVATTSSSSCYCWGQQQQQSCCNQLKRTAFTSKNNLLVLRGGADLSSSSRQQQQQQQHRSVGDKNNEVEHHDDVEESIAQEVITEQLLEMEDKNNSELQSSCNKDEEEPQQEDTSGQEANVNDDSSVAAVSALPAASNAFLIYPRQKSRRASDLIVELQQRSGVNNDALLSLELRQLITQRTAEYVSQLYDYQTELFQERDNNNNDRPRQQQQQQQQHALPTPPRHPLKLLHFLARKVPAIQHAPDVALRIQAAASDMDCGVAACVLGTAGHVCELYDQIITTSSSSVAAEVAQDRRFEQLVECVLCGGVDLLPKTTMKKNDRGGDDQFATEASKSNDSEGPVDAENIEQVISAEGIHPHVQQDGLSIRDACRAAWGIAMIGTHHPTGMIGDVKVSDILTALSVRVRKLLLGRVQLLRQDDMIHGGQSTIEEGLNDFSDELAEDAASAMWAFASVTGVTGVTYPALFDVCASILCQDPFDIRRRGQEEIETTLENLDDSQDMEATLETVAVGSSDVVERLARSNIAKELEDAGNSSAIEIEKDVRSTTGIHDDQVGERRRRDALLDWLSPHELTDVLWAVALHGGKNYTATPAGAEAVNLTRSLEAFCEIAFDRTASRLQKELESIQNLSGEEIAIDVTADSSLDENKVMVEVVDASTVLNSEAAKHHEDTSLNFSKGMTVDAAGLVAAEEITDVVEAEMIEQTVDSTEASGEQHHIEVASLDEKDANDLNFAEGRKFENGKLKVTEYTVGDDVMEAIDASKVLASELESADDAQTEFTEKDITVTETTDIDPSIIAVKNEVTKKGEPESLNTQSSLNVEYTLEPRSAMEVFESRETKHFDNLPISSPRDLCCLAWAVTELHDPLRFSVTKLVTNIFVCLGMNSLAGLSGGDVSNLAWSIAKNTKIQPGFDSTGEPASIVLEWIVDNALDYAALAESPNPSDIVMQRFHPPELSRLVWSVSNGMLDRECLPDSVAALVYHSLVAAESNLSDFRTEDLVSLFPN